MYLFKTLIILFLIICSISCSRKVASPPLSREKLILIYADIQLAETMNTNGNKYERPRTLDVMMQYDAIFKKYNITPEEFYDSFSYYREHPKEMDELYEGVVEELTKRESENSKLSVEEKRKADSTAVKKMLLQKLPKTNK